VPGQPASNPPAARDYSKEAFVFESIHDTIRFDKDGTGERQNDVRVRVQSEAGVQQLGLLVVGYNATFDKLDVRYARVVKPDGTVVDASGQSIQDLPAEVARIAPQYSDFRQKHINLAGLRPGDTIEYSFVTHSHTPVMPGQFWADYSFERSAIVLDERLTIDVPADSKLKLKTAEGYSPTITELEQRRVYTWSRKNTAPPADDDDQDTESRVPDVQLSSIQDWGVISKWYDDLAKPQAAVTDAVRAKAEELTRGLTTEDARVRAVYNYVASNIRYVSLSFGLGRFQPHTAAEVLRDQYGDCKDKHTLFAALLGAIGVSADPVLIGIGRKLDPDVPSIQQFDHVITAVRRGSSVIFADTTAEVAPFAYLIEPLRDKQALLARADVSPLVRTPAATVHSAERIGVDAHLDTSGNLDGTVTIAPAGDSELVWRLIMRRTPETKWAEVFKTVCAYTGLDVDVSDVTTANLSDLNKSLEVRFHITKKRYTTWTSESRFPLPIFKLGLLPAATPEQKKGPIKPKEADDIVRSLKLEVPEGLLLLPPVSSEREEDFADFRASYKADKQTLTAERSYHLKKRELPRSRYEDYNLLYNDITSDEEQAVSYRQSALGANRFTEPPSGSPSADALFESARDSMRAGNLEAAEQSVDQLLKDKPRYPGAWALRAQLYLKRSSSDSSAADKAIDAYKREIANNPRNPTAWRELSMVYFTQGLYDDAAAALRKQLEVTPLDHDINSFLGELLVRAGRPAEAIEPLESALAARPDEVSRQVHLAGAYFKAGQPDKGKRLVEQVTGHHTDPMSLNSVASLLADVEVDLDKAKDYMDDALDGAYSKLKEHDIRYARADQLQRTWKLSMLWDSAGWLYFKRGDLAKAQKYAEAAWSWDHSASSGEHLARIYLKQGKKEDAIRIWAQALAGATVVLPDIRSHMVNAVGSEAQATELINRHKLDEQNDRTLIIDNPDKVAGSAELLVFVGAGSSITGMAVTSGDDRLMQLEPKIKVAKLHLSLPDDDPIYVLRGAVLSCSKLSTTCTFVLNPTPKVLALRTGEF
jgi:predicted Zn-dependent protease